MQYLLTEEERAGLIPIKELEDARKVLTIKCRALDVLYEAIGIVLDNETRTKLLATADMLTTKSNLDD